MNTILFRTLLILLTVSLGTHQAWSSQSGTPSSAEESQAASAHSVAVKSKNDSTRSKQPLPGIVDEEYIPAFLRTDPCDTGND